MVTQALEMPSGWPLGLEIVNMRLRGADSLLTTAAQPYSLNLASISFSTYSSSNLDTESIASFFQDNSVSLGRLIGMRPCDQGGFYLSKSIHFKDDRMSVRNVHSDITTNHGEDMSQRVCIPLLLGLLGKNIRRNKSNPKG